MEYNHHNLQGNLANISDTSPYQTYMISPLGTLILQISSSDWSRMLSIYLSDITFIIVTLV